MVRLKPDATDSDRFTRGLRATKVSVSKRFLRTL